MMNILIAPDSFKDALNSIEVADAIGRGIKRILPEATLNYCPIADGGEGTLEVLARLQGWKVQNEKVKGPLFEEVHARWLLSNDADSAFIEMAQASGLQLLKHEHRNPMYTSSYGTGQLIGKTLNRGVKKIMLSIGGSATNDAGIGMAAALGWRFLDKEGKDVSPIGQQLQHIHHIIPPPLPYSASFEVWCDVENPLYGAKGAAYTYARQKGANDREIEELDKGLRHIAELMAEITGKDIADLPGAGAAGGMGAGAAVFLNAKIVPGIESMLHATGFHEKLEVADLVITGEGRIDHQTKYGKVIRGICNAAQKAQVHVVAFCGSLNTSQEDLLAMGLLTAVQINDGNKPLRVALAETGKDLEKTAEKFLREFLKKAN